MTDASYALQMVSVVAERLRVVKRLRDDAEMSGATIAELSHHDAEIARVTRKLAKYRKACAA
jgi:hypothetical protein